MDDSFQKFKTYMHLHQAEQDLSKLKSEGIEAYLTDKNMGSSSFLGAAGGVKIHVAEKDFKRAQQVLSGESSEK